MKFNCCKQRGIQGAWDNGVSPVNTQRQLLVGSTSVNTQSRWAGRHLKVERVQQIHIQEIHRARGWFLNVQKIVIGTPSVTRPLEVKWGLDKAPPGRVPGCEADLS